MKNSIGSPRKPRVARSTLIIGAFFVAFFGASPAEGHDDDGDRWTYGGGEVDLGVSLDGTNGPTLDSPGVQLIAEMHGVSATEALEILNAMEDVEIALIETKRLHPDTYAGG